MNPLARRARSLAIPPMHRHIPRADRIKVLELVLRRQFGAACELAMELEETRRHQGLRLQTDVPTQREAAEAAGRLAHLLAA